MNSIFEELGISQSTLALGKEAEKSVRPIFDKIDETAFKNHLRVQKAFYDARVSAVHFAASSGYGLNDEAREAADKVYASAFGAEAAIVRPNFVSGTHTLSCMLFAALRPGDTMLAATGEPYDTLHGVIRGEKGSLSSFGINYKEVPLKDGAPDREGIRAALSDKTIKVVWIQRSKGYVFRPTLSVHEIGELAEFIKSVRSDVYVFCDNCYGEFAEEREPVSLGVDLMGGSLIKNPGGGLAQSGGYIAGREELVEMAADALTAPGLGMESGCNFGMSKSILQGFYMAPHTVAQAMKTAVFCSSLMQKLGFDVSPLPDEPRADIIEAVRLGSPEMVEAFCQGIQLGSPVDSFVTPVPSGMPGYGDEVIMAAGTFTQGASIEITADAPMREPYVVYMQGALSYESGKTAVLAAAEKVKRLLNK